MTLLGLDIGTNACKAIVFSPDGTVLAAASREYPVIVPQAGWAEQDAELVWRRACECLAQVTAASAADPPRALALAVQGEAVILTDDQARPLRNAILGMDARTEAQNAWLADRFGADGLFARTGAPVHTVNTLPKLLWLREHDPAAWKAASRFMLYEDFVLARLGAVPRISHCLASRTQLYNLVSGGWDSLLLEACEIPQERLSALSPAEPAVVGMLSPSLAGDMDLRGPVALASGGHDQACAALGSGATQPGVAMVSTGSAEVIEAVLSAPLLTANLRDAGISIYRHVVPGRFLAMTLNQSAGLALRWYRDALCGAERDAALARGVDPYDALLAGAPPGPTSLLVMPHLAGSGTPHLDPRSRGAFLGLSFATTRAEIAQGLLEGLTFELRSNLEVLREAGIGVDCLHAVGGGARSALWLRLKSDICRLPLRVPSVTEAACLGASLLAGSACGTFVSLDQAVAQTVRISHVISPDRAAADAYEPRYALYQRIYPLLCDLNAALSGAGGQGARTDL